MMDGIRIVLVDPGEESREVLLGQLEQMPPILLSEVCIAYRMAADRIAEIRPDLTIVVADSDTGGALEAIRATIRAAPEAVVLAGSASSDSRSVLNLVRSGAREVLSLPASGDELLRTIQRLTHHREEAAPEPGSRKHLIAVTGATGEAGCTTVAVNLATTLAKASSQDVALIDLELMFGCVDAVLDVVPEYTLADVVDRIDRIDLTLLKRMLARHPSGLYVLPRPVELHVAAKLNPDNLEQALQLLKAGFSTLVFDTSKGLQLTDFLAFEAAEYILVVCQLDPTSVQNTARLLQCFREHGGLTQRLRVVANRVGSQRSTMALAAAEEAFGMPVSWQIPNATKVVHAARDRGVPIDAVSARSDAQRVIAQMARDLVPTAQKEPKPSRGFFRDRFSREA